MYIYVHTSPHTYTHEQAHPHAHTHVYIFTHTYPYRFIQIYQYLRMSQCMHVCTYTQDANTCTYTRLCCKELESSIADQHISHVTFTCEMLMHTPTHIRTTVAAVASASTSTHILALAT